MKKILNGLLVLVMLISMIIPFYTPTLNSKAMVEILYSGSSISDVTLSQYEKIVLEGEVSELDVDEYQWQIYKKDSDEWIDIYEQSKKYVSISYALISSLMSDDQATIRLEVLSDEDLYYSSSVDINIKYQYQNAVVKDNKTTTTSEEKVTSRANTLLRSSLLARNALLTHTITIEYQFENGNNVFAPYVATLASGTPFEATIKSPLRVGYLPYFEDGTLANSVTLDYDQVNADEKIVITYKPQIVSYKIKRYGQNTYDDNYTLLYSETKEGLADSLIENADLEIPGFTQLYYELSSIAADGSTELNIYYDRNYYLLHFNLFGGYGVEPVYARYGTAIMPNTPLRAGYVFDKWTYTTSDPLISDQELIDLKLTDDDVNTTNLFTIPYTNITYKAVWITVPSTYTIIYWKEDTDYGMSFRPTYSYWTSITVDEYSNTEINPDLIPELEASFFDNESSKQAFNKEAHFFELAGNDGGGKLVEGDGSTVVNVMYNRKEYTLRYYYARSYQENGSDVYQVVGGTTYPFGAYHSETNKDTSLDILLANVTQWGKVKALPSVNEDYYDRYRYGTYESGNYTYHYLEFTEKYGADLSELWPIGIFDSVEIDETHTQCNYTNAYFSAWNGEYKVKYTQDHASISSGNETIKGLYMKLDENVVYTKEFADLAQKYEYEPGKTSDLVNFLGFWDNGANIGWSIPKLFRYNIMLESLDGEGDYSFAGGDFKYDKYKTFDTFDDSSVQNQTATSIDGFTYLNRSYFDMTDSVEGVEDSIRKYDVYFFYDRNKYELSFYNYNQTVSTHTVPFDQNVKDLYFVPDYPDTLEKNAYEFTGWYTTPDCIELLEFDFDNDTMPANDLELYAGWQKVKHKLNIYLSYDDMLNQNATASKDVTHGNMAFYNDSTPTRDGYRFMGWFYIDDGEKKAFKFGSMPVNEDIELYAEWQSESIVPFTISYVTMVNGQEVKIADDMQGLMNEGVTRTFKPKGGSQLYSGYQSNYYPTVSSHSIEMGADNNYKFVYEYRENIKYKVEYREAITQDLIDEALFVESVNNPKEITTSNSVVTEQFVVVDGYVPDAFQKRLTLSLNEAENKIVFYYTKDDDNGIFYISHYLQQNDGTYVEVMNETGTSPLGTTITRDPKSFEGYSFVESVSTTSGVIDQDGLHLEFYYDLNEYDYKIQWLVYGSHEELCESEVDKQKYGQVFSADAKVFDGYTLLSAAHQEKVIQDETSLNQNIITFYYSEEQVTLQYKKVVEGFDDGSCYVTSASETIGASSGTVSGSKAVNGSNYIFEGWYLDEACTQAVTSSWVENQEIIPKKNLGLYEGATYYAKFKLKTASLTINKDGWDEIDVNQSFIFHIKGKEAHNEDVDMDFIIHENGSMTIEALPVGLYEIKEIDTWSWRYDEIDPKEYEVKYDQDNSLTITNTRSENKWLDGDYYKLNEFAN